MPGIETRAPERTDTSSGRYADCNDTHMQELLLRDEGILLSRSSVRRMRRQAGQKPKQRHRPPPGDLSS